ncbi:MAG: tRNA 2-selenouridine(34) synthase MnmH [Gammaproteobacteria bacterium]
MHTIERQEDLSYLSRRQFDDIIDVRSPSEFAEDHIPGAVNLPVLDDTEREEVGTVYCQKSRQLARRIGATYVTKNISNFLAGYFSNKPNNYRPLVYCWRGGMRSQSMATILNSVGWYTNIVDGGYRRWRRQVVVMLREERLLHQFILIDGQTGAGKTKVLHELSAIGGQTLDIEGLANHRGSVFGGLHNGTQPSQKYFESLLFDALESLDPRKVTFVEAESPKIGRRALPKTLVEAMKASPRIELEANLINRADNLVNCYADLIAAPTRLATAIEFLHPFHSGETITRWKVLAANNEFKTLARELVESHYDPCYARQRKKRNDTALANVTVAGFGQQNLRKAAEEIMIIAATHKGSSTQSIDDALTV